MPPQDDRSIGELITELTRVTGELIRKEVELARTELTAIARHLSTHAATTAVGGALTHAGLLVILAAIVIALVQLGVTAWLAAAIVGVGTMAIGYLLVNKGVKGVRRARVVPTHTLESLKEDARWTTRQGA